MNIFLPLDRYPLTLTHVFVCVPCESISYDGNYTWENCGRSTATPFDMRKYQSKTSTSGCPIVKEKDIIS